MTTIARQHALKQQTRLILIAATLFTIAVAVTLFAKGYRAMRGGSTMSLSGSQESSRSVSSAVVSHPRGNGNPLRGFRQSVNVQ